MNTQVTQPSISLEKIAERIVTIDERDRFPYETTVKFGPSFPVPERTFFGSPYDWTIGSKLYELRDVVYDADQGEIVAYGHWLRDYPRYEDTWPRSVGVDSAKLERCDPNTCFVLGAHRFKGYHHWLMSDVPAIAYGARHASPSATLLTSTLLPYQSAYLKLMGLGGMPRKEVESGRCYHLPHVIMTDFHLQNNIFQISLATLRAFAEIRRSVPRSPTPPRIYISRGDANHRRVLNESELYPALSRFGFTVIKLEQLSLPVQINIFRNAKCVVAPHGAGLTNLGFGNRGTHIFEMLGQGWVNACFNVMVKAMRMHHWVDVYPVSASSVPIFADMTINVPDFIEMLGLIDAHIKVARDLDAMYV